MSVQYVRIYYGPNESYHTVLHRPQKLRGMKGAATAERSFSTKRLKTWLSANIGEEQEHLQRLGFRVDLIPVEFINYCVLEMCGHEVFRCNIKNLSFNTSTERDPVCQRAINAVVNSSAKFLRARSYLWSWALIDEQIFRRSELAPKDYWPFNLDKSFSMNLECVTCL